MKNYFSTNIKFIREQKGLSQNKFGELLNVNQTTIARWEDENRIPTIDKAIDISLILNIPLNVLVCKDLRLKDENNIKFSPDEEMELLKNTLKKKGFLNENEELNEEDFNKLIEFAKINKPYIMRDTDKE
ncbi:MAG: helix-turn-helix transcriptional regulator [Clostridia bacterium]|nr:helix-turn-helix transcriptional regulator [Clostridia bacterium]